jgi:hypothetical protein
MPNAGCTSASALLVLVLLLVLGFSFPLRSEKKSTSTAEGKGVRFQAQGPVHAARPVFDRSARQTYNRPNRGLSVFLIALSTVYCPLSSVHRPLFIPGANDA